MWEYCESIVEDRREDVDIGHPGLSVSRVLWEVGESVAVVEKRTLGARDDGPRHVLVHRKRDLDRDRRR